MTTAQIVAIAIVALLVLGAVALVLPSWLLARRLRCPVALGELVGMRLRKAPAGRILRAGALARAEGLDTSVYSLEIHALAGGDPEAVVTALAEARQRSLPAAFEDATALDLAGWDVVAVVRAGEPLGGLVGSERAAALGDRFRKRERGCDVRPRRPASPAPNVPRSASTAITTTARYSPLTEPLLLMAHAYASIV